MWRSLTTCGAALCIGDPSFRQYQQRSTPTAALDASVLHGLLQRYLEDRDTPFPLPPTTDVSPAARGALLHEVCARGGAQAAPRPRLLCSACLLGYPVEFHGRRRHTPPAQRADGVEKKPRRRKKTPLAFIRDVLWRELGCVECVPLCPEVDLLGLAVPRDPIRLTTAAPPFTYTSHLTREGPPAGPASLAALPIQVRNTTTEATLFTYRHGALALEEIHTLSRARVAPPPWAALLASVDGVLLKARSPSCGVRDARLYHLPAEGEENKSDASGDACPARRKPSPKHFQRIDGFFTASLRRALQQQQQHGDHGGEVLAPITSESLLTQLGGADEGGPNAPRLDDTNCLPLFLQSVLRHFEKRIQT